MGTISLDSLVVVKPQTYTFRFSLYTLVRGLSDSNLVLLAKIAYNELFTQTHISLCRRESCTARVLALHSGKWGECVFSLAQAFDHFKRYICDNPQNALSVWF